MILGDPTHQLQSLNERRLFGWANWLNKKAMILFFFEKNMMFLICSFTRLRPKYVEMLEVSSSLKKQPGDVNEALDGTSICDLESSVHLPPMWVFPKIVVPQNGWL